MGGTYKEERERGGKGGEIEEEGRKEVGKEEGEE